MTAATHVRYGVVALATSLAMITYLDRACIATLAPGIMRDLALTTVQMGYVFTAFQLAYALFELLFHAGLDGELSDFLDHGGSGTLGWKPARAGGFLLP